MIKMFTSIGIRKKKDYMLFKVCFKYVAKTQIIENLKQDISELIEISYTVY